MDLWETSCIDDQISMFSGTISMTLPRTAHILDVVEELEDGVEDELGGGQLALRGHVAAADVTQRVQLDRLEVQRVVHRVRRPRRAWRAENRRTVRNASTGRAANTPTLHNSFHTGSEKSTSKRKSQRFQVNSAGYYL